MRFVGFYKEFSRNSSQSMEQFFADDVHPDKAKIIDYLKNGGKILCASTGIPKDAFTKETIKMDEVIRKDQKYAWPNILAYYVEKYNLRLPREFENHILGKSDNSQLINSDTTDDSVILDIDRN